jgi:type II restriction enzyme
MDLTFNTTLATQYRSASQKARVLTEDWVSRAIYCPNCGRPDVTRRANNSRIGDFFCSECHEEFEVKSLSRPFRDKVEDGEYRTMITRLNSSSNPNIFLLHYDPQAFAVLNCIVIPKHFLRPDCIEARAPLSSTARRAGWTGCRILLGTSKYSVFVGV